MDSIYYCYFMNSGLTHILVKNYMDLNIMGNKLKCLRLSNGNRHKFSRISVLYYHLIGSRASTNYAERAI
ncbi:hypothetical protein ES702_03944 [subsurface metagenome]